MKEWLGRPIVVGRFELPFSPGDFLFTFAIPVLGILAALILTSLVVRRITRKYVQEDEKQRRILMWSRRILRLLAFLGVVLAAVTLLGAEAWRAFGNFFRILNTPFFSSGNTAISVVTLLLIVPVVAVASWTGKLVNRGLESRSLRRFGLDAEQAFTIGRLLRYLVMSLVFIFGLSIIGIDLSAIGVLFGVLGIGIGFGLQSLVADFFAGITLISMGLVKEGDRIRIETYDGIIKRIRLMNTELLTFENETLIIPNGLLTGGTIHNYSYKDQRVIILNEVDVSYGSNLDEVIRVLRSVAERNPWLQAGSETHVRVKTFAESGITMQLRTWIQDVVYRPEAASWTNLEIWRAFAAHSIEIPFPQRVVHRAPEPPAKTQTGASEAVATVDAGPPDSSSFPSPVDRDPRPLDEIGGDGDGD